MKRQIIKIDRNEMYDWVWSKPLTEIAEELGTSAVAIGKRCRSHGVPAPGVGYWQKKEAGKEVHQIPLPKFDGPQQLTFHVNIPGDEIEEPPVIVEARQFESRPENRIVVGKALYSPHRLISDAKIILEHAASATKTGLRVQANEVCLNIRVSPQSLTRALRIMDALIKALEVREASVELKGGKSIVIWGNESMEIDLYEFFRDKSPEDKTRVWRYRDYVPTGELNLRILSAMYTDCKAQWRDGKKLKLEERLNDFVNGLRVVAEKKKKLRIRADENELRWQEEMRKRRERERVWEEILRRRQAELQRRNQLDLEVSNWRKACQIRAYVEEVRRSSNDIDGPIAPGEKGEKWIEWALQQAERIDPLR